MNSPLSLILIVFFMIYSGVNFYVGWRGWQALQLRFSHCSGKCYSLIIILLASLYPVARVMEPFVPITVSTILTLLGAFWLGTLYYLFLFTLMIDVVRIINHRTTFLPVALTTHPVHIVTVTCCLTLGLILYGAWNARHPITQNYEITIPKSTPTLETLHVVMVSDIHLGTLITNRRLTRLVNRINQLEPDIVLLAGDMIDGKVDVLPNQHMIENFARIRSTFGTYGILGNHEYIDQKPDLAIQYFEQGKVHILRDQYTLISENFYLVGRDDISKKRYSNENRQELGDVMAGINRALPILLLDHQPNNLQDGVEQGVDLQLSGHTHLGQLFPNNLLTHKLYEIDWGYLRKESMQIIVSCGFGSWGPPIRIGNQPEIVNITIHFTEAPQP